MACDNDCVECAICGRDRAHFRRFNVTEAVPLCDEHMPWTGEDLGELVRNYLPDDRQHRTLFCVFTYAAKGSARQTFRYN